MVQPIIQITPGAKGKRTRKASVPLTALPALSGAQQTVLLKWLKSDAQERTWQSLLQAAGSSHLEVADALVQFLLFCGAVALKEEFRNGQWWPWRVVWTDLEALQTLVGLTSLTQRETAKASLNAGLLSLAQAHPWLAAAVDSVMNDPLPTASKVARAELLHALAAWQQSQRQGMRQDFALAARGHTKAITSTEWDWLEGITPLESLGVGRFEPLIWLAGSIALCPSTQMPGAPLPLGQFGFIGLPCRNFGASMQVSLVPKSYWLIENRASFERQTSQLSEGQCLVWLPGRPSNAWLEAMRWLLVQAPAPAAISCDPDPAGIQIALTAGAVWDGAGMPWQTRHMDPDIWCSGITLPLNDYDRRVLAELQANTGLPADLATLRDYLLSSGTKAEQEGWL
jgi:hypothetical protein